MPGFVPGAPYLFVCEKCSHHFQRKINLGLFCPACKSLSVKPRLVCKQCSLAAIKLAATSNDRSNRV